MKYFNLIKMGDMENDLGLKPVVYQMEGKIEDMRVRLTQYSFHYFLKNLNQL